MFFKSIPSFLIVFLSLFITNYSYGQWSIQGNGTNTSSMSLNNISQRVTIGSPAPWNSAFSKSQNFMLQVGTYWDVNLPFPKPQGIGTDLIRGTAVGTDEQLVLKASTTNNPSWISIYGQGITNFTDRNGSIEFFANSSHSNGGRFTFKEAGTWKQSMMIDVASQKVVIGHSLIGNQSKWRDGNNKNEYKLFVETGIITERLKVALVNTSDWADYVFTKDYKLMNLYDLELFIQKNKHLPNIPSAEEIVEGGGIDMNEMFAKQMAKIEELTLYVIELKKQNDALEGRINQLENK